MVAPEPSGTTVVCRRLSGKVDIRLRSLVFQINKPEKRRCTSQMQLNVADCANFANISQVITIKSVI